MHRDYYDQTGLRETKYDEFETKRLYGSALNKYNEIRKLYPNLPSIHLSVSDPLSGLAQIQQLCATEHESLQKIIDALKNWQKSQKTHKQFEAAKLALPPIAKTYEILCRSRGQCGAKTADIIRWLGSAEKDGSGYYPALLEAFSSAQVIADLENWQAKPAETRQDIKREPEGTIKPTPPEFLQKLLWILKYGRKYAWLLLLALFLLLFWGILTWPKFRFFSKFYHPTKKHALNDYGRTTKQELTAEKREIAASTETKTPHTIKDVQSKHLQVQVGKAYSDPTLGLIITVKSVVYRDYAANLHLVLPGHKPRTEYRVAIGKSWDFQTADTQYKLVLIETDWHKGSVLFELSQIVYKQAEK
ncbi:MAG: hypothetical protein JSV99_11855 [Planctomycetota bacterium]|nr:MAG: hypothetical protein JSV99_11855 [Planctomycetota bacterium]